MPTADEIIRLLDLAPLPGEGGYFRETYRSPGVIPGDALPDHPGDRCHSTQIYYLLTGAGASKLHRVRSDEAFHFYGGSPVTHLRISPGGDVSTVVLGPDPAAGHERQTIVPGGWWQGAILSRSIEGEPDPDAYALMGCTVSPGFEWEDFELIDPDRHASVIEAIRGIDWSHRLV